MKKLGKLLINPGKVLKNEELVSLKGGGYLDGDHYLKCTCTGGGSGEGTITTCDSHDLIDIACDHYCPDGWSAVCV